VPIEMREAIAGWAATMASIWARVSASLWNPASAAGKSAAARAVPAKRATQAATAMASFSCESL
jgi:hypothetical protein